MATRITARMLPETRAFVRTRFGEEAWTEVLGALGDARSALVPDPPTSGTLEFGVVAALLAAVADKLGPRQADVLHALGRHNAEMNLAATERILMKILTVKIVLRIASILWKARVKDGGSMVIVDRGKRAVGCRIEAPPEVSPHWWPYLKGWFQRTVELAGGREVDVQWTGGGSQPREAATYEVTWS